MPQTPEASILQLTQDAIEGDPKVTRKGIYHLAKWQNYQVVNGRRGSDLEKLRRILKALEKRVAALEESARIALGALSKPAIVDSTSLPREQLVDIVAIREWNRRSKQVPEESKYRTASLNAGADR